MLIQVLRIRELTALIASPALLAVSALLAACSSTQPPDRELDRAPERGRDVAIIAADTNPCETLRSRSKPVRYDDKPGKNDPAYLGIVDRVIAKIKGLRPRYPHLVDIDKAQMHGDRERPGDLTLGFTYAHGDTSSPNPDCHPASKCGQTHIADGDGIGIHLTFFTGPWLGRMAASPYSIDDLHILVSLEGGSDDFRDDICRILLEEKTAFERAAE